MAPKLFAAALFMIAFAGCTSDAAAPEAVPEPPMTEDAPMPVVSEATFGWMASVGVPTTGQDAELMATNAAEVMVPGGTATLDASASWSCGTPLCDMHVYLYAPGTVPAAPLDGEPAAHDFGASPITLSVTDPEPGTWTIVVHDDAAAFDVSGTFTFVVTPAAGAPIDAPTDAEAEDAPADTA